VTRAKWELELDLAAPIDVYAVGWLEAWKHRNMPRPHGHRGSLRREWNYMWRQIKAHEWRAVKNTFNGYLAEAQTDKTRRAGHGWTEQRALRDLERHVREMGALQ
jgi:hypothetical protein